MIQDLYPNSLNIDYLDIKAGKGDFICFVDKRKILLKIEDDNISLPKYEDFNQEIDTYYLFSISDHRFFVSDSKNISFDNYQLYSSNEIMDYSPKYLVYASLLSIQLVSWLNDNKYCGRCGNKNIINHNERMLYCPSCHNTIYPRINPCVIVGIINKDKILLTKANVNRKHYALVSGFCEAGETLEETVKREVKEEVGLNIKNLRYYKSQPWPLSDSLLMGFYCDLDGDDRITIQESELVEAIWCKREDIIDRKNLNSLTAEMIDNFKYKM